MITKIKSIQNFHIFQDFIWNNNLEFKKYNLIYGWNGSGKTTLSKFLRQIELKEVDPDCEDFNVITNSGTIDKKNITESTLNLKVFNQDFVKENIFTVSGEITPIFYLGQKDIATKKIIESLKAQQAIGIEKEEKTRKNADKQKKVIEKYCTGRAKEIRELLRSPGENKYNNYDTRNFKSKYHVLKNEEFQEKILSQEKLDDLRQIISSKPKEKILLINLNFPELKELESKVQQILSTTVTANVIERLNSDGILNLWVSEGLSILKVRKLNSCPFCNLKLPEELIKQLDGHFNNEYKSFTKEIDQLIRILTSIKTETNLLLPSKSDFYDELSGSYEKSKMDLLSKTVDYANFVNSLINDLNEKRKNPFVKMGVQVNHPNLKIKDLVEKINSLIEDHNTKTNNFTSAIQNARQNFEEHIIAENATELIELEVNLETLENEYRIDEKKSEEITQKIVDLETKIVEHRAPAEEINLDLQRYLGHEEIKFDLEGEGYQILRNGIVAQSLSEGEKNSRLFYLFPQDTSG